MSNKNDGSQEPQNAKVLKLGFNISVSGDPGTDFEIILDDNKQKAIQSSSQYGEQLQPLDPLKGSTTDPLKYELEKANVEEVVQPQSKGAIPKHSKVLNISDSSDSLKMSESEQEQTSTLKDISIINKIKSTMEHFEKFSDHIKEIPRLRDLPLATSTPFSDKCNSKSESNLAYPHYKSKKYPRLYDFYSKKDYYKSSVKPPDLFLKPLPGEGYYKRSIYSRYDVEPYKHYGSDSSLNIIPENKIINKKPNYDFEKYEDCSIPCEPLSGILKKSDSESGDRHSTSSADSIKDIKIYQTGGILIMQNFKDSMDVSEKREISEFSAKLIENCNRLRLEMNNLPEDKPAIGSSYDDNKNSGKIVQFDLSSIESKKSKSGDSSLNALREESSSKMESSESTSDCLKNKDTSPQGTSQSQDFPSLSTQENDSILSNQPGMSPSYASSKKLEWDSGADVGYLNLDLTKENLSTIEKIVLKGLSSDGLSEKNVVYEKKPESNQPDRSKFIMERKSSDPAMEIAISSKSDTTEKEKSFPQEENEKCTEEFKKKKNFTGMNDKEMTKEENRGKLEETKSASYKNSSKANSSAKTNDNHPRAKPLDLTDKCVNVNTLFDDNNCQTLINISNSLEHHKSKFKKSPKLSISKSKKLSSQRLSKSSKKLIPKYSSDACEMGVPKKVYKKVEATPALNDFELSREVEEIIVDQRFKIKQNVAVGKEVTKESEISIKDKADNLKEVKSKSRPISASSSSNNTVLPKSESRGNVDEKTKKNLVHCEVIDQIIQTSDYDCESIGVQAFASQVSSDSDFGPLKIGEVLQPVKKGYKENVTTSSKNIQVFGLNSSLPKQLENPKETALFDSQQTKSTQFFGGPLNSLPNYHSNLVTKPGESCGRALNILKTKKNSEAEIIRLREENEKNILANDALKLTDSKKRVNDGNKENLITRNSRGQNSWKSSKGNVSQDFEKKESEQSYATANKNSEPSNEGSEPHTSDEVSSMVLTYEVLKVHGESIDRNIIQEKYFQSQLVELEKRKMVSRSTSMEMHLQLQSNEAGKEFLSTGCQYSSQSSENTNGEHNLEQNSLKDNSFRKTCHKKSQPRPGHNKAQGRFETSKPQEQSLEAGDSLPSSTQTAHSWIPGMQNSRENTNGVGKARSFEYLPGHIYESSGNLREELPSETEQNLITSSSSDSDTAKGSDSKDRAGDSEGRSTLILENSSQNSHDSDRLKILDETLAQLNVVVLKLSKKDAQVQSVTQSLLANLWKKSGSGDCFALGEKSISETEAENKDSPDNREVHEETFSKTKAVTREQNIREEIACQTEEKLSSEPEQYYEEKKALEKRINKEKHSQIKWIENEIQHLNVLRELLEKQSSPTHRKKKLSPHTITSSEDSKDKGNYQKNNTEEICPRTVTPVYGCTISLSDNTSSDKNHAEEDCRPKEPCSAQYNMAVSLTSDCSKNWKHTVMVPVGLQVSLNNPNFLKKSCDDEKHSSYCRSPKSNESNVMVQHKPSRSDINIQCPSARNVFENPSASVQTNFPSIERLNNYAKENCFCINLSDKSSLSVSRSSKSKTSEKRNSPKLRFSNEESGTASENKTSNTTDPEFAQMESYSASQSDKKIVKTTGAENFGFTGSSEKWSSVHGTNFVCNDGGEKFEYSGIQSPDASTKSKNCKCQNHSERVSFSDCKPGIVCRRPCQSNIYLSSERSSVDSRTCRCSKIQVQKSLHGNCHIIKIHGSKCCSNEKSSTSCGKRSSVKKTENQCCQTDPDQVKSSLEISHSEAEPISENKSSVLEKSEKAGFEKIQPSNAKLSLNKKYEEKNKMEEMNVPSKVKTSVLSCNCKRKIEQEKNDEHPRHYFLKIEEKEVDDSNEPEEQKKSLEVITVTVPVKRAGKSKIFSDNIQQRRFNENPKPFVDVSSVKCNCCSNCTDNCQVSSQDYNAPINPCYRKNLAEKPVSPTWSSRLRKLPESFYEDVDLQYSKELPQRFSSSQEYYQGINGLTQTGSSFERAVDDDYEFQCCKSCNCINRNLISSRETKNQSGSLKTRTVSNTNERFYEGKRKENDRAYFDLERRLENPICNPRRPQTQKHNEKADRFDPDYYNYNKREFMTKSEILNEEKQRRKAQQPSLQECLSSNRPDFYSSAERRREVINKRTEERILRHNNRMECLLKMMQKCNEESSNTEPKRMFTTLQMREQTMKRYRKLPEVTGKIADQKKKEEYKTNRLMADVFAKKLQIEALKETFEEPAAAIPRARQRITLRKINSKKCPMLATTVLHNVLPKSRSQSPTRFELSQRDFALKCRIVTHKLLLPYDLD